jgi:cell division protein FtsW
MGFHRKHKSFFGSWWWTIDRITLAAIGIIIALSAIMVAAASPAVADRIGVESFYFVRRQLLFLIMAVMVVVGVSQLSTVAVRRLAMLGFLGCIITMILVLFKGVEIKGAHRWLSVGGFSLQPSEFIKPCFAVVTGWVLSKRFSSRMGNRSFVIAAVLYGLVALLLVLQPDIGMTITVTLVWCGQLFLAGLPLLWIMLAVVMGVIAILGAYQFLPHVAKRIDGFLDPEGSANYQIKRSLEAFKHGGFYGRGPGEGTVKQMLPDSHTDFIFAVVGEELGMITCLLIVVLCATVVLRGFSRVLHEADQFIVFAVSGLLMEFGMQSMINMAVTLHLLPTKGMTLPFISYGGSSTLAIALAVGMLLALTRKRYELSTLGVKVHRSEFGLRKVLGTKPVGSK